MSTTALTSAQVAELPAAVVATATPGEGIVALPPHGGAHNIAWGTVSEDENIVWATTIDENIVWGTTIDENIVWGTTIDENIVWGTTIDENIVWGTSIDATTTF
jgi:hypothetical protein